MTMKQQKNELVKAMTEIIERNNKTTKWHSERVIKAERLKYSLEKSFEETMRLIIEADDLVQG